MSTEEAKPDEKSADKEAAAAPKKPSAIGGILKLVIPALFAAGAAYGGTRFAAAKAPAAGDAHGGGHDAPVVHHAKPPGPTLPLEPFLVTVFDANKKPHPMKMTIAVEFDPTTHDDLKTFTPRIRDVVLTYLRSMSHEQATDPAQVEKLRTELVEKCQKAGAHTAERVLVTDFVVQ
jgi:flagellar basal body-associated protein FliL